MTLPSKPSSLTRRLIWTVRENAYSVVQMNLINSSNGRSLFSPTIAHRIVRAIGILGTRDLCCQSKTRFVLGTAVSICLAVLFGSVAFNEMVALWLGVSAFITTLLCLAIAMKTPLRQRGTPVELGPSIFKPSMQCTFHLCASRISRHDTVMAIFEAVGVIETLGMSNALLESPLLSSSCMRNGVVDRLNSKFIQNGYCWRAIDLGRKPQRVAQILYSYKFGLKPPDQRTQTRGRSIAHAAKKKDDWGKWGMISLERKSTESRQPSRKDWLRFPLPFRAYPHAI
jgi:hypothetical protein